MIYQGVDENDIETGPLKKRDLAQSIHRRVALILVDETGHVLEVRRKAGWDIPQRAVRYKKSSESEARRLLNDLGFSADILPLGGILQMRDNYSTLTHIFLVRWSGSSPNMPKEDWHSQVLPVEHSGPYRKFINQALKGSHPRSLHIREDLRY